MELRDAFDHLTTIRTQLAATLQGVVSQTLVARASGTGRVVATEVLVTTPAIANLIREGKAFQITSAMQAGRAMGMHTMDQHLADLVSQIGAMAHVRRVRIHSRVPIVLPDRVTESLLDAIRHPRLQTVMVVHCNHANEIDETVLAAMDRLRRGGMHLLNQAVLLAGVNDSAPALVELSERLFAAGVLPYYLHLLDKVAGAAHFDVPQQRAIELMAAIAKRLPGYLVPKLVRELPGEASKTRLW